MSDALKVWQERMQARQEPKILLCGAKHWENSVVYDEKANAPNGKWVTSDLYPGDGVDVVIDLQGAIPAEHLHAYDGVFCPSVLEHVQRPWVAVRNMAAMLRKDGLLYIATHQTFPLHFYPSDYFRFSATALETMCRDADLDVIQSSYYRQCRIIPPPEVTVWNEAAQAFLDVAICAYK